MKCIQVLSSAKKSFAPAPGNIAAATAEKARLSSQRVDDEVELLAERLVVDQRHARLVGGRGVIVPSPSGSGGSRDRRAVR
jgi:hypothetical protein